MRYHSIILKYRRLASSKSFFEGKNFIDNNFEPSVSSKTYQRRNPYTGDINDFGIFADSVIEDVDIAVRHAHNAFKLWSKTEKELRTYFLAKLSGMISQYSLTIAEIISQEMGKPITESLNEVKTSVSLLKFFSEETQRIHGHYFDQSPNKKFMIKYQAHGVVGLITPWNFPLNMIVRSLGALLGAGCTTVIKPSSETPMSALFLAKVIKECEFPKGVVNIVTASREMAPSIGEIICHHPLVRHISFTGSTKVGKLLLSKAASTVKRCSMELGGNAPAIIFESADIKKTVKNLILAKFRNSGQTCISPNRIFVNDKIYDEFLEELTKAVSKLKIGDPMDEFTNISCLYDEIGFIRVDNTVKTALTQGAKIHYESPKQDISNCYYPPTILIECNKDMNIFQCEIFGPVCCLYKFSNQEDLFREMNDCPHGLAAYIYSQNMKEIYQTIDTLNFGLIAVNEVSPSNYLLPFSGHKESGIGSEMGITAIYQYMDTQSVVLNIL